MYCVWTCTYYRFEHACLSVYPCIYRLTGVAGRCKSRSTHFQHFGAVACEWRAKNHWECDKPNNHPCPNGLYWPSIFFVGLLTLVEWEVGRPGSSDSPCHVSNLPSPDPRWKHPLFFEECLFPQSLGAFCFNISSIGGCFHWPKTSTNRNHHFPSIFHQFFWLSKSSVRSWGVKGIDFGLGEFWGETLGSWIFL